MKTMININTGHSGLFFSLTYFTAFLEAIGMKIHQGKKKGYPVNRNSNRKPGKEVSEKRKILLLLLLSVIIFIGRKWFDFLELTTIMVFLIPTFTALIVTLYRKYSIAGFRWVIPVILVCAFSFMSQTNISNLKNQNKITFTEVGIVGMIGKYSEELQKVKIDYNCNGNTYHYNAFAKQSVPYYQTGINLAYHIWYGRYKKMTFGNRFIYGDEYPDILPTKSKSGPFYAISPYASLNWRWFGFTTGFSWGRMKVTAGKRNMDVFDGEIISKGRSYSVFIPSLSVRLGSPDIFFAEGSYASGLFPYASAFANFNAGVGTGFGKSDGTSAMIGLCGYAIYLKMVCPIKNKFVVEAFYADNISSGNNASRTLSLGFNYRFLNTDKNKNQLIVTSIPPKVYNSRYYPFQKLKNTVTDVDGNVYSTIGFKGEVWMGEDLNVKHFNDGTEIRVAKRKDKNPRQRYSWDAVVSDKKLCPAGWHVPSQDEWNTLVDSLGESENAAIKMENDFSVQGKISQWWTTTEEDSLRAQSLILKSTIDDLFFTEKTKKSFLNVRCIKDH